MIDWPRWAATDPVGSRLANQFQHVVTSLEPRPPDRVAPGRVAPQPKLRIVRDERAHRFDAAAAKHRTVGSVECAGETARANGVAPCSSSTVGSAPWASSRGEPGVAQFWINAALRSIIWLGMAGFLAYHKKPDGASPCGAHRCHRLAWRRHRRRRRGVPSLEQCEPRAGRTTRSGDERACHGRDRCSWRRVAPQLITETIGRRPLAPERFAQASPVRTWPSPRAEPSSRRRRACGASRSGRRIRA